MEIDVFWMSNMDYKAEQYVVEKSIDGIHFEPLVSRDNKSNSAEMMYYQDIDSKPGQGRNYYRLKLETENGEYAYSEVKEVYILETSEIHVFPNPARHYSLVNLDLLAGKAVEITVSNHLGIPIKVVNIPEGNSGLIRLDWHDENWADGFYMFSFVANGHRMFTKPLIISRK